MSFKKRGAAAVSIAAAGALVLAACGTDTDNGDTADGERSGGEITWAIASGWASWNLWTEEGNVSYLRQALTPSMPRGGEFQPDGTFQYNDAIFAAEKELLNESPLQVAYTLNPDANWGDGNPITIKDFIYHWHQRSGKEEHCDERCAQASTVGWDTVVSIEEDEEGRIVYTYEEGYITPEWSIGYEPLGMPQHVAVENGFEDWETDPEAMGASSDWFAENPPTWSAGPYIPVDAEMGEHLIFEPNPDYAGSATPQLDKLTLEVIDTTESIITELRDGTISGAWPTSYDPESLRPLDTDDELHYEVYAGSIWDHFDINLTNEFLSDQALREAVFTATDVQDVIDRVWTDTGITQKVNHIFGEESPFFVDHVGPTGQGSGDVEAARGILEDAGYSWNDADKLLTPEGEQVAFEFRMGAGNVPRETMAELFQAYMDDIGIDVTLNPIPDGQLGPVLVGGEFDVVVFGWSGNPMFSVAPEQFWASDSGSNFSKLDIEEVDQFTKAVNETLSLEEAAEAANAATALVVEAAAILPISDQPQVVVHDDRIGGLETNGNTQSGPLWNVEHWFVN